LHGGVSCPLGTSQLICNSNVSETSPLYIIYTFGKTWITGSIVKCEIRCWHNAEIVFEKGKRFNILCAKRGRNTIETERSDEFEWIWSDQTFIVRIMHTWKIYHSYVKENNHSNYSSDLLMTFDFIDHTTRLTLSCIELKILYFIYFKRIGRSRYTVYYYVARPRRRELLKTFYFVLYLYSHCCHTSSQVHVWILTYFNVNTNIL